ncbi:MAG TPA: hypothetical protein VEZ72_01700, partial [Paenibacillus sp.]|nr:hypothetical protein [Paenibacillus sp.]
MKRKVSAVLACALAVGACVGSVGLGQPEPARASGVKLALSTSMVVNESGRGDAGMLVDEQSTAGDPKNGTGGSPTTTWFPG